LADTAYYQSQHKSSPFDYPVEFIRQELEDKYTTRVAQGGLAVYTSINGDAPATAQELSNYKHPDWYGNDYEPGHHLMGLIMKVDRGRNEASVRFGNYTATLTAADMGWSKRQPGTEFKNGDLAEFDIKEVDEKNRRLTVEL